jgi:Acetyltransferase (GNAT) family
MSQPDDRALDERTSNAAAIARIARERGWPAELAERMTALKLLPSTLDSWAWFGLSPQQAAAQLAWHERMTIGDLRGRDVAFTDNDAFAALWADSPEEIGEWEVTVERGPDAFAQFKLQENVHLPVLSLGGELVACCGFSRRNVLIQGRRVSVLYGQALRVRRAYRRKGYGDQVRRLGGSPAIGRPAIGQYDLMRTQNYAVVSWWKKFVPSSYENVPESEGRVPGSQVTISQFPAQPCADSDARIRPARREDIAACAAIINRTHAGMDLFRPYSAEWLESVLDEGFWSDRGKSGPNPALDWWKPVYSWRDYFVVEERGRIAACGGLWDRGRDMRERWRRRGGDQERVVAIAALLDFGYAEGAEPAMAALLSRFIGRAHELGRDYLAAPIDHLPALRAAMEAMRPEPDTRALRWTLKDPAIVRPYTDLRYW